MNFFETIANTINHEYEPGIGSEINSFLEYNKIEDFELTFDQEKEEFNLVVNIEGKDSIESQQLFKEMLLFIEFPYATFYNTELSNDEIKYNLISYTKENRGFVLKVVFNLPVK